MTKACKKTIIVSLCLIMLFAIVGLGISTVSAASVNDLTYEIADETVTIIDCNESASGKLVIPNTIEGYPVTSIGEKAFEGCAGLTSVIVPDSVISISQGAFKGCNNLKEMTIPFVGVSRTATEYNAVFGIIFDYETSYGDTFRVGLSTNFINQRYGMQPEDSTWQYTCANTFKERTYIGGGLNDCYWITSYYYFIPSSLNTVIITDADALETAAFMNCNSITSISFNERVSSIGDYSFRGCNSLENIMVDTKNHKYHCAGNCLIETNSKTLLAGFKNSVIPDDGSVITIGDYSFYDCATLTSITIPENVKNIGSDAFNKCSSLKSLVLSDSVISIGYSAFDNCPLEYVKMGSGLTDIPSTLIHEDYLKTFIIGNGVTNIYKETFRYCEKLSSITIGNNITLLDNVFSCCPLEYVKMGSGLTSIPSTLINKDSLKTFIIGNGVTSIDSSAFKDCSALSSLTIGNSVKSIGDSAFFGCTGLTGITIPNNVTVIGKSAFSNCSGLTSAEIGSGVTTIDNKAFSSCTGLTNISIPNSTISIGSSAFSDCTDLTSITVPDSVTSIGGYAFSNCSSLTSVNIGTGVTTINGSTFSGCTNLGTITLPEGIIKIGDNAFHNTAYYNNASNWSDNLLYIGNYLIKGKTNLAGNKSVKSGTTCIADSALSGCNKIITLTVPASVNYIGSDAFGNVTNVAYTGTATGSPWGARCLNGYAEGNFIYRDSAKAKLVTCSGLASGSVIIPASTDTIGDNAFSTCSGITSVYIPVNVTRIGVGAFQGTALTDVYYEGGATEKLVLSIADNNAKVNDATWHYNSKVSDMPSNPTNPDNPSTDIPEGNIIKGNASNNQKTYDYRTTVTFTANVPSGGSVQWYVDEKPAGTDKTLTVKDMKTDYTVKVVVTDKNGNRTMDEEQVTIKHGFFDIIIWFFVHLFNPSAYNVKQ